MSSLYTRRGDSGTTSLANGERVSKVCDEVEAYGTLDELGCHIGMLATLVPPEDKAVLQTIQQNLFDAGSVLARSPKAAEMAARLNVEWLEREIDKAQAEVPSCSPSFILPGGEQAAAWAHICRSICRRAERQICRLTLSPILVELEGALEEELKTLAFVNRLSDYFFALAQKINKMSGTEEIKVK